MGTMTVAFEQLALPYLPLEPAPDPGKDWLGYGRRLALAVFLDALRDARGNDPAARLWVDTEGRGFLDQLGLEALAQLDLDDLLLRVNGKLLDETLEPTVPYRKRRCWNCGNLIEAPDGTYLCAAGMWTRPMARSTVYATTPRRNCDRFIRSERMRRAR